MLDLYPQFINWQAVAEPGKPKPRKVPFDPMTGRAIDPHDPKNWKSRAAAIATGHRVGFVLTAKDPFFFLDLDDCYTGTAWQPEATAIYQMFPGAAAEVSISGTGLHIMGTCDQARLADRRHKWRAGVALEFYTAERFIALGHGFTGDFSLDWTETLLRLAPVKEIGNGHDLAAGAVPDYTGMFNDDELIQRMVNSRGSIGAQFGTKASAKDLWDGDAANLCQVFPSPSGDVYDRSSADAALMAHLAFWTGKDTARMDVLFRRSMLVRPKYTTREDYRKSTIQNAISNCKKVYDVVRSTPGPAEPESSPSPGGIAGEFLSTGEQVDHFAGCVYVRDAHRIMIPGGTLLRSEQFNATFGGKVFNMSAANDTTTKKAFEAFTENRAYNFPKVDTTCFRPSATSGAIIGNKVNVYFPDPQRSIAGDPGPFLNLVGKLLPDTNDYAILLAYMAAVVQSPGVKFQWAPVLQGTPGNGKSAVATCLEKAIGTKYSHRPSAEDLGNPFNAFLENKLLISVEEVYLSGRRELLDTLKPLITNDRVEVQAKGIDKRMIDNYANWIMLTNHRDAILKTKDDRRYAIFFTAQQTREDMLRDGMTGDYFRTFWDWLRDQDGYAIVTHFLQNYKIPKALNPAGACQWAPDTTSTFAAITASMGRAEQELIEAIDAGDRGFRNGWVSMLALDTLYKEKHIRISRQKTAEMLETMGFKSTGRANKPIMAEDMKRPVLYVQRGIWSAHLTVEEYCFAQGYTAERAPAVVPFGQPGHLIRG